MAELNQPAQRGIRRVKSRKKRMEDANDPDANLVKNHPRVTIALPPSAYRAMLEIKEREGVTLNTLGLRAYDLLFTHHKKSFKRITGENPWEW